jgi:DnaJ-class molecular chaperone
MNTNDHYATLGVAPTATADEIKRAFRRLASQHHPDKGGDTGKFQQIQAAYDTLGDEARRRAYDNPQPQFSGFPGGAQFNMGDIFSQMFGQHMAGAAAQHPRRNHMRMSLWITLRDVATGGRRQVALGSAQGQSTIEIDIPRGINDGDMVQYQGIAPGGQDLVIEFRVQPHPQFRRDELNLTTEHRAGVWDMILGGDTEVVNIEGSKLVITIPPLTANGTTLRLRHRGIQDRHGNQGDLFVKLQAQLPESIAPELAEAIRQHR